MWVNSDSCRDCVKGDYTEGAVFLLTRRLTAFMSRVPGAQPLHSQEELFLPQLILELWAVFTSGFISTDQVLLLFFPPPFRSRKGGREEEDGARCAN